MVTAPLRGSPHHHSLWLAPMDPLNPPVSIVLALWAPSPSSHGLSLVEGPDGAHDVIGSVVTGGSDTPTAAADDDSGRVSLERWLASARPLSRVSAVLPSPAGGTGTWVLPDIEEGVVLEGAAGRVLLVPEDSGTSVSWHAEPLSSPLPPLDAAHARRQVHAATEEAIEALDPLDLARERPEMADALNDLLTAVMDPRLVPPWLARRDRSCWSAPCAWRGCASWPWTTTVWPRPPCRRSGGPTSCARCWRWRVTVPLRPPSGGPGRGGAPLGGVSVGSPSGSRPVHP